MRRFPFPLVAATLVCTGSMAVAQNPIFPRSPVRLGGVRAVPAEHYIQAPASGTPAPMPQVGGSPMGSTPLGNAPGVIEQRGTPSGAAPGQSPVVLDGPAGSSVVDPMGQPGVPCPTCGDGMGGMGYYGHPLFARPILGHFVQPGKWYGSAEYLYWWTKPNRMPPLLTTSSQADMGILGAGSTQVLLGNGSFGDNGHSGGRFNLGYWFGCDQRWGIDAGAFFLSENAQTFTASSNGDPLLARPFLNANVPQQFSEIVAANDISSGTFTATSTTSLWGADVNLRRFLAGTPCRRLDLIGGFKYLNLNESLTIQENVTAVPTNQTVAGAIVADQFRTENNFYGGQFGLLGEARRGRWYLDGTFKVAIGNMDQNVRIDGAQTVAFRNGTTQVFPGGLLALPGANVGSYSQNKFAVVPEATINLGYHLRPNLRIFIGYNFLYASSVLRPGEQIDPTIDVTRIPNFPTSATPLSLVRPLPTMRDTEFYAQGISFGLQFKW